MAIVESAVRSRIEAMYGARAELVSAADEVFVFELDGHPSARFCEAREQDGRVVTSLR